MLTPEALFHGAFYFAICRLPGDLTPLVVLPLAACDGDLELNVTVLGVELEGDEGLPFLLAFADEAIDLFPVQQQFAVAGWELPFMPGVRVGRDVRPDQEHLPVPYPGVALLEVGPTLPDGLYLALSAGCRPRRSPRWRSRGGLSCCARSLSQSFHHPELGPLHQWENVEQLHENPVPHPVGGAYFVVGEDYAVRPEVPPSWELAHVDEARGPRLELDEEPEGGGAHNGALENLPHTVSHQPHQRVFVRRALADHGAVLPLGDVACDLSEVIGRLIS